MAEPKRPLYFNSQFLVESDFQAEQAYQIDMRRLLNLSLHTSGVVNGLEVQVTKDGMISVTAGMALDKEGREIMVPPDSAPRQLDPREFPGPDVFITIKYAEVMLKEDRYTGASAKDMFTRATARPQIQAVPVKTPPDDGSIKLAHVTVSDGHPTIDTSFVRPLATSLIATGSNADFGNVTISGSLELTGNGGTGTPSTDRPLTIQGAGDTYLNIKANNGTAEVLLGADAKGGVISTLTDHDLQLRAGQNGSNMIVKADGSVGIGIGTGDKRLTIDGNASLVARESTWGEGLRIVATDDSGGNAFTSYGRADEVNQALWEVGIHGFGGKSSESDLIFLSGPGRSGKDTAQWSGSSLQSYGDSVVMALEHSTGNVFFGGKVGIGSGVDGPPTVSGMVHLEVNGKIRAENLGATLSDIAENYLSDMDLAPGDVVCLDPDRDRIVQSEKPNDPMLLGVVSTEPGVLLDAANGEEGRAPCMLPYPIALSGRVPCRVTDENGAIRRGDLLTTSSTRGHAMKASPVNIGGVEIYRPETLVGKALQPHRSGKGVIEVFVL